MLYELYKILDTDSSITLFGYLSFRSVAAFSKLVDQYWGEKDRQDIGKELSKLCRRYGYRRGEIPDERWNRVYTYPPFIQKEWCLRNHVTVPEELQDVYE